MLELNITARIHNRASDNIIGLKEEIAYKLEDVADVLFIDVKASAPLQLSLDDKPKIRQTLTVERAREELIKNKLTIEEYKNIIQAIVDITKIECVENSE